MLNESIETTQDKLNQLKKLKEEADKKMAEGTKISAENYRNLQREIILTENKLNGLTDELKQFNSENSNWTKTSKKIEEYGDKIQKVSGKLDELGNKMSIVSGGVVAGGVVLTNSAMNLEDALAKYVSSTNVAEDETEKYKKVLEDIYKNNYGENYEDIANSMSQISMQLKNLDSTDLQNITEKSLALRDLYGYEVSESVRSVKTLMDNFNISVDEAFNLLAEGKKQGLDFSNELLDNVNEYSVQFGKLGLSAEDMFNIFKTGSENGAFNLDKIGDAVKEFSIRAIDGSDTTIEGFKKIGLNADEMAEKLANGGEEAKETFIEVIKRLGKMDDKVEQSLAGVDLFGTMWEDLGPTVISSFSEMDNGISKSSDSMQKSIDELYNTTKKKAEKQLKRLQSLGADFGEEMLPVLEDLIDMAEGFIKKLEGMSDEEKENIVKIGLLVAAAGPLIKIMGTTGDIIGGVEKTIGNFSEAIDVARNKTTASSRGVETLGKVFSAITSPAGLATTAVTVLAIAIGSKLKEAEEKAKASMETISNGITDFFEGIDNAEGYLDRFNETLFSTTEEQQALEEEMKNIQNGITQISKTASDERRAYTQQEIDQLNNYFQKMRELQQKELEIQQSRGQVLTEIAQTEIEAFNGSYEGYKLLCENWIKTAQQQADTQKQIAENYRIDALASLKAMYGDKATLDNEEYARAVQAVEDEYNKRVEVANQQVADISLIYSEGATQRLNADEDFNNKLKETVAKIEETEKAHAENVKYIKGITKENSDMQNELLQNAEVTHGLALKDIWKEMDENLSDSQREQLGSWIANLAQTELYGNDISEENERTANAILKAWEYMPDDSKKAMKDTMEGMLKGMEDEEPSLFAKASSIANGVLSRLKKAFDIHSPSKETRKIFENVMKGSELGIKNEEKSLYKLVDSISNNLLEKMRNIPKRDISLDNKTIEKNKTIFTTPQITFNVQELDEARLEQCFNYINRKFGSRY